MKAFDIWYRTTKDKSKMIFNVREDSVENTIDELFKDESMFLVMVKRTNKKEFLFSHCVIGGSKIYDKSYKGAEVSIKGRVVMKLSRDGERNVESKYPIWDYGSVSYIDGYLNIKELLENS